MNAELPSSTDQNPKLLVVDDEPATLRLVKTLLQRAQYDVVTCGSGTEAMLRLQQREFDCIITDAMMPEMDGYDFIRTVRRGTGTNSVPILMLTRRRQAEDVKAAVEAGVTDYVLKPIDEDLLLHKVELCLKKGQGNRHVYVHSVHGQKGRSEILLETRATAISETQLTLRVPLPIATEVPFRLKCPLFEEIGIPVPYLRLLRCEPAEDGSAAGELPPFEATFAFVGIGEPEMSKIRGWVRKQEIQRRK